MERLYGLYKCLSKFPDNLQKIFVKNRTCPVVIFRVSSCSKETGDRRQETGVPLYKYRGLEY